MPAAGKGPDERAESAPARPASRLPGRRLRVRRGAAAGERPAHGDQAADERAEHQARRRRGAAEAVGRTQCIVGSPRHAILRTPRQTQS